MAAWQHAFPQSPDCLPPHLDHLWLCEQHVTHLAAAHSLGQEQGGGRAVRMAEAGRHRCRHASDKSRGLVAVSYSRNPPLAAPLP